MQGHLLIPFLVWQAEEARRLLEDAVRQAAGDREKEDKPCAIS